MAPRILEELVGAVEAHGQAIQQARVEGCGLMALEPGGAIHEHGKAGGVGLGEAVFPKALNLGEEPLREGLIVAPLPHTPE